MYSPAYVWAKIITHMENLLSSTVVSTWFEEAEILEFSNDTLTLYCPSAFCKETIERRYICYIKDALKDIFDSDANVIVLGEEDLASFKQKKQTPSFIHFNPQFTFDKFVVGSSNRFAYNAAKAVADMPADTYNPLFIYGDSGLGKTHLLYAIAAQIERQHPDYNIVYFKGSQFTNELIESIREGKNVEFRGKYRNADLFLMDDIQFIAGKESTEEEFFHTFNLLYENHKQIVLTSDQSPSEMLKLTDRLRTRFEWGLICDITPPDYETRMAITKNKATSLGLELPDDVCDYIAQNITNNVRQIEGTVKKIKAYRDLSNMPLDLPNVSRAIKDMYKGKSKELPTPSLIIGEVSRFYSIEEHVLRSTLKNKGTAEARQIAMYLIRKLTNLSLPDIGKEFGKDHTTVMYSINKIEQGLKNPSSGLQDNIRDITSNINNKL